MEMTIEIDENFYCSADSFLKDKFEECLLFGDEEELTVCTKEDCSFYCHKYPTPEQFKEEFRKEWKGAAYYHCTQEGCDTECDAKEWTTKEHGCLHKPIIVCACTPIGKPPSGWRPK